MSEQRLDEICFKVFVREEGDRKFMNMPIEYTSEAMDVVNGMMEDFDLSVIDFLKEGRQEEVYDSVHNNMKITSLVYEKESGFTVTVDNSDKYYQWQSGFVIADDLFSAKLATYNGPATVNKRILSIYSAKLVTYGEPTMVDKRILSVLIRNRALDFIDNFYVKEIFNAESILNKLREEHVAVVGSLNDSFDNFWHEGSINKEN